MNLLTEKDCGRFTAENLAGFATEDCPIRCSSLPALTICSLNGAFRHLSIEEYTSGEAAQTGTAVHYAVAKWHNMRAEENVPDGEDNARRNQERTNEAIKQLREFHQTEKGLKETFRADFARATQEIMGYTHDARNWLNPVLVEEPIEFSIDPSPDDPTGKPIFVNGTLDQVRQNPNGYAWVVDLKSSTYAAKELLEFSYLLQIAAYARGATNLLGYPVAPGMIIRTRSYSTAKFLLGQQPDTAFAQIHMDEESVDALLDGVRESVAMIRSGALLPTPSTLCRFCPLETPISCPGVSREIRKNLGLIIE